MPSREEELKQIEAYARAWKKAQNTSWLFPHKGVICQSPDYLEYFNRTYGPMMLTVCPLKYKWELLEENKEKIIFSNHLIAENGWVAPYSMLQFGPRFHVAADWIWNDEDDKYVLGLNVFHVNHDEYLKILNGMEKFEYVPEDNSSMGFGGLKHHAPSGK